MKSEKEKLAAKSVEQLKAAAKRLGGKLVTPDGKAKTKQQLINTIVMKQRLAGKSMGENTTTKKVAAKKTVAKNYIFTTYSWKDLAPTIKGTYRIKITDQLSGESVTIPFTGTKAYQVEDVIDYLKSIGIKIIGRSGSNPGYSLLYSKGPYKRIKK